MQTNDDRQRVLDATDLVRLIGEHVTLRAKGREYMGLCPFHDDHKPSMYVVPSKQIYHCFSCGAGGNAFTFVMNYHKMGFRDAIEYLADKGGVKLTPWSPRSAAGFMGTSAGDLPTDDAGVSTRSVLLKANLTARDFFRAVLAHPEHGAPSRELIARRSITPEMVEAFELGAAPDRWDGLLQTVQKKGLELQPLLELGLLKPRESGGGAYDAFRDRLIFPIHDQIGRVIGFGGRRLRDRDADGNEIKDAKYLNSAESVVFNKSTTLYGLHQAAQDIRRSRLTIITEGYMDTIACHQAGVRNAVAALGTALTPQNAKLLRRLCETVVLLFDGDAAGQKATDRALEALFAEPIDVKIALMSSVHGAKDPDELLKQPGGLDRFHAMIAAAEDAMEYRFSRLRARITGLGLAGQTRAIQDELARLVELGLANVEPMRQRLIVKRIAALLRIDEDSVQRSIPKVIRRRPAPGTDAAPSSPVYPATRSTVRPESVSSVIESPRSPSEQLIACALCDGSLLLSLSAEDRPLASPDAIQSPEGQAIAAALWHLVGQGQTPALAAVLLELPDPACVRCATSWQQHTERLTQSSAALLHQHWRDRLDAARRESRERRLAAMLASPEPPAAAPIDEDGWSTTLDDPPPPSLSVLLTLREHAERDGWNPARVPKKLSG